MNTELGTTEPVTLVQFVRPRWRRLTLFQSWSQLLSYSISVVVVLAAAELVLHADGTALDFEMVVCGALGALAAVQITEASTFTVLRDPRGNVRQAIETRLERAGFVSGGRGDVVHYRHRLPRWLTFRENDVYLKQGDGVLQVSGPRYLIKVLHKTALAALPQRQA